MIRSALILFLVVWPILIVLDVVWPTWKGTEAPAVAICGTDTDCMRHCPEDDLDCDGGPQQ